MYLCYDCAGPTDVREAMIQRACDACGADGGRYYCTTPISCRWCRQVDPNAMLHNNNHGGEMGLRQGYCIAQYLRRNHLRYAIAHEDGAGVRRYLDLFLALWTHVWWDRAAWVNDAGAGWRRIHELEDAARAAARELTPPEPHVVAESEQMDLFGVAS